MTLIKPLIFILVNMLAGFLYLFAIKVFLFIPSREKKIFGKHLPLTPAFVYRKKIWLLQKITSLVNDYIRETKDESKESRISQWEQKMFQKSWDKINFMDNMTLLPKSFINSIKNFLATIIYELTKHFLRTFVPYILEKYEVNRYLEILDMKLDIDIVKLYFNKYIYKYVLIFVLSIHFLIGLGNMLIYLCIR
ncbi:MAG: hypothetical protein K9N07_05415 [Candidatus Cloacimonetes bacterium]|nr:hypothetical protein [Candidatus Cloacimonadota bacterium]